MIYLITFQTGLDRDSPNAEPESLDRYDRLMAYAFSHGPAWMASANAVFFKCETSIDELRAGLAAIAVAEFVFLAEINSPKVTAYLGWLADDEGYEAVFGHSPSTASADLEIN